MKLKFLDSRNCHALFPRVSSFSLARTLDNYLQTHVNDKQSVLSGKVDELIKHNARTQSIIISSKRLMNSPVEIGLVADAVNGKIAYHCITNPISGPALFHAVLIYANGLTWKTIIPLQFLLKGWGDANDGYQCYVHSISNHISKIKSYADMIRRWKDGSEDYHYAGITGRDWLLRFREHMEDMKRGSMRRLHQAWRKSMGNDDVHFISQLGEINLTYEQAMNWEEQHVDKLGPNKLNMLPGGFKGLQSLYKFRFIKSTDVSLEERDKAIVKFVKQNPRKGVPNPFIAELWQDDEFYLKIIEARPKTLTADQVRKIREMAKLRKTVSEITKSVDALNELQVRNVISGKNYSRIN